MAAIDELMAYLREPDRELETTWARITIRCDNIMDRYTELGREKTKAGQLLLPKIQDMIHFIDPETRPLDQWAGPPITEEAPPTVPAPIIEDVPANEPTEVIEDVPAQIIEDVIAKIVRGANISDAIIELLAITQWGELDYLVIDMPPGINDGPFNAPSSPPDTPVPM